MTLVDIFVIVLIAAAFLLPVFAIIFLKRLLEKAEAVRIDIHQLVENTLPVMRNLEEVTERANRVVTEIEGYWNEIDHSIKNVRQKISLITSLKSFQAIESPAKYLVKNIKALTTGTSAFWNSYKNK